MNIEDNTIPPITFEEFAAKHDLTIEINERTGFPPPDRYYAMFKYTDVVEGGGAYLRGTYGNGATKLAAIDDYKPKLLGQQIKVAPPGEDPRYIQCPNEWNGPVSQPAT